MVLTKASSLWRGLLFLSETWDTRITYSLPLTLFDSGELEGRRVFGRALVRAVGCERHVIAADSDRFF